MGFNMVKNPRKRGFIIMRTQRLNDFFHLPGGKPENIRMFIRKDWDFTTKSGDKKLPKFAKTG